MKETCHGTLVMHALPDAECTDPHCADCEQPHHTLVIPCTDIDGDCPQCVQLTHALAA